MFTRDDPLGLGGAGASGPKRMRMQGGFGGGPGANTFSIISASDGQPIQPIQPTGFAPVTNIGDNPPCSTLFVGNLGDAVSEHELRGLFAVQPGFRQVRPARRTTGPGDRTRCGLAGRLHFLLSPLGTQENHATW